MRYIVCGGVVLFLGFMILSSCAKQAPDEISWASSLENAFQIASEKDQPVIVEFWSEECKWCERLQDSTFTHQSVIDLARNMVFVKAEAKEDTIVGLRYRIAGFPTVILMNSSGEEIDRIYGYLPPEEFVSTIQDYLQGKNTLEDFKKRFEAQPDGELAFRLADKYEGRRMYEEARVYYNKVVDLDPENEKGNSDDALFNLAWLELRKKDYSKAVDAFKYFLQKFPKSEMGTVAERIIPYCHAEAGDTAKAMELYEEFLVQHPDSPDTGWVKDKIKALKGSTSTDETD